jgi:hypothetical protein
VIRRGLNLLVPDKADEERNRVAQAWAAAGGIVTRIGRFWDPPPLERPSVRLYGNDSFALVLAQKLGLTLVSPADDLLIRLPVELLKRDLRICPLQTACETARYPLFAKPVVPKQFRAAVYGSPQTLAMECAGLSDDTPVYLSEIVRFSAEARAFVLESQVLDAAIYEGAADAGAAGEFLAQAARQASLPAACVLDAGYIEGRGWAVVEANAAWGAGLNGCSAEKVLPCIAQATRCLD